jgi:hypothetical protein
VRAPWRRRAERRAVEAAQLREHAVLVSAADWSITVAREWWNPGQPDSLQWATVADVVERAREDEGLEVTHEAAAAVLRERLELRGRWGLHTDAYLGEDGTDQRRTKCTHCIDDAVVDWPGVGPVCMYHSVMHEHLEEKPDPDASGFTSSVVHDSDWYQPGSKDAADAEFKKWMREHRKGEQQ